MENQEEKKLTENMKPKKLKKAEESQKSETENIVVNNGNANEGKTDLKEFDLKKLTKKMDDLEKAKSVLDAKEQELNAVANEIKNVGQLLTSLKADCDIALERVKTSLKAHMPVIVCRPSMEVPGPSVLKLVTKARTASPFVRPIPTNMGIAKRKRRASINQQIAESTTSMLPNYSNATDEARPAEKRRKKEELPGGRYNCVIC
ncbi:hypothetical protein KR222_004084 [Zaprionus bogoriensis]|nr:hypothetical protein KR222_004084 [Zaprionus bogoriensis]